jgi:hypothetical protein
LERSVVKGEESVSADLEKVVAELQAQVRELRAQLAGPVLVERQQSERERDGKTYEEDNWDKLSPAFREAHNQRLQTRGLPTIPPPPVDNYKPSPPSIRKLDMSDPEAVAAARSFMGASMKMPGDEGFTVNGVKQRF